MMTLLISVLVLVSSVSGLMVMDEPSCHEEHSVIRHDEVIRNVGDTQFQIWRHFSTTLNHLCRAALIKAAL